MSRFTNVSKELQLAALAAIALAFTLILPWYQKSFFQEGKVVQANVSAFGVFTFVEAAVLLVAAAVLFLVWARSQRKGFHLPGGDGVAITIAGGWAMLLLIWRLFDKPDIQGAGATMGIQWGIFGAMLAAGALIVAGARVRALHAPEPPNPAADEVAWVSPARWRARTHAGPAAPRRDRGDRDVPGAAVLGGRCAATPRASRPGGSATSRPRACPTTTGPSGCSRTLRGRTRHAWTKSRPRRTILLEARTRRERRPDGTRPLWDEDGR